MGRRLFACFRRGSSSSSRNEVHANGKTNGTVVEESAEGPVLVELFSSQGCVTSPAAELLLSRLGRGDFQLDAPVIVLAYHVDYWDYMGWKDPYGSSLSTVRQKAYVEALRLDTMFTPQVVVQGRAQCVGNDEDTLLSTIAGAPRFPAPTFQNLEVFDDFDLKIPESTCEEKLRNVVSLGNGSSVQLNNH
ncbi:hypothetical protein ES319_A04G027700v1 [Gossypium barbadense]|uniref:Thioredoxin-like fold domain-containing protein n=1 Tax=Gossypium barbadense TaxID=3634 RepID=A0A5J5W1Q1_GOSBA|nr:hypothetical protein ES319_A04G027700v1 [Gossypium barbadense]KAB2086389.1 hypothetical protein ES319_A04G027700v1 [Gossypium barbadense]